MTDAMDALRSSNPIRTLIAEAVHASDPRPQPFSVAEGVIRALERAGYRIVRREEQFGR